jgi:hypothetical protein
MQIHCQAIAKKKRRKSSFNSNNNNNNDGEENLVPFIMGITLQVPFNRKSILVCITKFINFRLSFIYLI